MSRIIALHSFRHGTGQSSLTANLAVTLAQQGARVGLIDTDIQFPAFQSPGLHAIFGIDLDEKVPTLSDYIFDRATVDQITTNLSSVFSPLSDGSAEAKTLYLIPFRLEAKQKKSLFYQPQDLSLVAQALTQLANTLNLDYILIDIYPGLSEETLLPIAISDLLILTLRPDKPDFQGTAVILDVAQQLELPNIMLAVNQVVVPFDLELLQYQLEVTYHIPVLGILPFSEKVRLLNTQELFCLQYPDHPFSQTIRMMGVALEKASYETQAITSGIVEPEASAKQETSSGVSMLDILTLPDEQRQLMNWMLRQGTVSLEEVTHRIHQDQTSTIALLEQLIAQGFLQKLQVGSEIQYQALLAPKHLKRSRRLNQDIWNSLEES